jgi:hypothetical protein
VSIDGADSNVEFGTSPNELNVTVSGYSQVLFHFISFHFISFDWIGLDWIGLDWS